MSSAEEKDYSKPVFWGFMLVGFLSLLGGIAMFVYVVPKDMDPGDTPRDVGVVFTDVYTQQLLIHNESGRYAAALTEVKVEPDVCDRYNCRLTTRPDGQFYIFRMSKNGRTWTIETNRPVPKPVT